MSSIVDFFRVFWSKLMLFDAPYLFYSGFRGCEMLVWRLWTWIMGTRRALGGSLGGQKSPFFCLYFLSTDLIESAPKPGKGRILWCFWDVKKGFGEGGTRFLLVMRGVTLVWWWGTQRRVPGYLFRGCLHILCFCPDFRMSEFMNHQFQY